MVIVVRLQSGMDYAVDSFDIDGQFIELRRTSASGKPQLTTLPLEDIFDLQSLSPVDSPMHIIGKFERGDAGGLSIES